MPCMNDDDHSPATNTEEQDDNGPPPQRVEKNVEEKQNIISTIRKLRENLK